jgi:hypothetical protein
MSVRKRRWITNKGEAKEAWIVDYVDQAGDRHIQTFARKKEADDHWATVKVEVRKGVHIAPSKARPWQRRQIGGLGKSRLATSKPQHLRGTGHT